MIKLTQLRYDAGLSPDELSRRLESEHGAKLSAKSIRAIEAGSRPRPSNAKALADFFDVTPTDLLRPVVNSPLEPEAA